MLHLDEARLAAIAAARAWVGEADRAERALLIEDLFGLFRAVAWATEPRRARLAEALRQATTGTDGAGYWSGEVWAADAAAPDREFYEQAWREAAELVSGQLRLMDRHRSRSAWFTPAPDGPWPLRRTRPPVVAFYSFKGGVGRTTALAAFAIQRARSGERVVAIDGDLDAPGLGALLPASRDGTSQRWGVVDYLLERRRRKVELRDYYHAFRDEAVVGAGEILVVPAGQLDPHYLGKLARVDLEPPLPDDGAANRLGELLNQLATELRPQWMLVDTRSGLSDAAGLVLAGLAHLQVVLGTASAQSWAGLTVILDHLGADRVRRGLRQADCVLVQAMTPRMSAEPVKAAFARQARAVFEAHYYAEEAAGDAFWTVGDADASDAPHVPVPLSYDEKLAAFDYVGDVAPLLISDEYRLLSERIRGRFPGAS